MNNYEKKALIDEFLTFMEQKEQAIRNEPLRVERFMNISENSESIRFCKKGFRVGDVISFTLATGEEVSAMAMRQDEDGMLFVFVDCLKDDQPMNPTDTNEGGYDGCALRKKLNTEILDTFPAHIKLRMQPVYKDGDLLRLLTEGEMFGKNEYGEPDGDAQLEPMKRRKNRIAFQGKGTDEWEWYWLQNKRKGSAAGFAYVYSDGRADYDYASDSSGVRPAFKIK